jgi:hypothetical protein
MNSASASTPRWLMAAYPRRAISTFSYDIAHAVSLDELLLSMQSSCGGGSRPASILSRISSATTGVLKQATLR